MVRSGRRLPHASAPAPAAFGAEALESRVLLATFTVTNVNGSGAGSLQQAILSANAAAGADTIRFNIPATPGGVHTIRSSLSTITGPTFIDGTTQPGYAVDKPVVCVQGPGASSSTVRNGLHFLNAGQSRVRGLIVNNWSGSGILAEGTTTLTVEGNWIGLDPSGTLPVGNRVGVTLASGGGRIGGTSASQRNVISGNAVVGTTGVGIDLPGNDNVVLGNYIGTNAAGTAPVGNALGVRLEGSRNRVGGPASGERNVISGNTTGVYTGKFVENTVSVSVANVIAGNYVGTDAAGTAAVPNTGRGIRVSTGSDGTVVGGTSVGAGNLISGNGGEGIAVDSLPTNFPGGSPPPTYPINTRIEGNVIGLSASGGVLGNATGIVTRTDAVIGGTTPAARNVISGNTTGIDARGTRDIRGNFIGLDPAGAAARPNGVGVLVNYAAPVTVGGAVAGAGNVISGNTQAGIRVSGGPAFNLPPPTPNHHLIEGNFIGTNAAGTAAVPNGVGVEVLDFSRVMIGGDNAAARNVISGNTTDGVRFTGGVGSVRNNFIGTTAAGNGPLGNTGHGVAILTTAAGNPVVGNTIAHNGGDGIRLASSSVGNAFLSNLIHSNGGLNIDLGGDGLTSNDANDADVGPNDRQNHPVFRSVVTDGTNLFVRGTVDGALTSNTFRVQFFSGPTFDFGERGEAAAFIGEVTVNSTATTRAAEFAATLPFVPAGQWVSATVTAKTTSTSPLDQTSEFSGAFRVPAPDAVAPRVTGVFVRRFGWSPTSFEKHLELTGRGKPNLGFDLGAAGADQLKPLPWSGLETISLVFSEQVDVRQEDLVIEAAVGDGSAATAVYATSSFSYAASTRTAVWRLAKAIDADRVRLVLNSAAVRDHARNALDGEWADAADAYPSGNGTAGGDFRFRFNVLPGDVNRNGRVDVLDEAQVRRRYGGVINTVAGGATADYSAFADIDGGTRINAPDLAIVRRRQRDRLP